MSRPALVTLSFILITLSLLAGCHPTQPFYIHEDGDLSHYLDSATEVAYPDLEQARLEDVTHAKAPLTVADPEFKEFWDLALQEAVSIALQNSKVVRGYGEPALNSDTAQVLPGQDGLVGSGGNPLRAVGTIFNVAINETNTGSHVLGAQQIRNASQLLPQGTVENVSGVEDALAEFDTQFSTSLFWTKTDRVRNFRSSQFFIADQVNTDATFNAELAKKTAVGTQFFFRNVTDYARTNNVNRAVGSLYTTAFEVEARHPLLRGRGTMINRIPVVLARIETDQSIAGLEAQLQNLVCNVEIRYWDLHCAYRDLETAKVGRDGALVVWRKLYQQRAGQIIGSQPEARAREQYFNFRSRVETALSRLYAAETNLRYLLGIATTDGRLIRPTDEPSQANIEFDWHAIHSEALVRRPLLRSQRWQVKQQKLQLRYAKNALLPELNVVGLYRWLGSGDDLAARSAGATPPPPNPGSNAFASLFDGNFQEAFFGFEFNMPVGFRRELARVRNTQLKLAREKAFLEDMELDASKELTQAIRSLETQYQLAQTHFNRWNGARKEVEALQAVIAGGLWELTEVNLLLDAQIREATAQSDYYRALCEYNKLLALVHRRKGSMLDYSGIVFAEGPWPKKAYWDALGHARRRDAAKFMNYGWTRPNVVGKGAVPQGSHFQGAIEYEPTQVTTPYEEVAPGELIEPEGESESVLQDAPTPTSVMRRSSPRAIGSGIPESSFGPELIPATGTLIQVPGNSVLK